MNLLRPYLIFIIFLFTCSSALPQIYSDQHYVLRIDSIYHGIESGSGIKLSGDGKSIILQDTAKEGFFILKPGYSAEPFNQGLPSWNGTSPGPGSAFKIQMRFPYGSGWSPWLTAGYWKNNIWSSYGPTSYSDGYIDYDYVKLYTYKSSWQFKVILTRTSPGLPSPSIHKLSFFVSDSRTTSNINYTPILNDNPAAVFIPTGFIYQYGVDPEIGPSICSPASVSMILRSYNITVDPYQFALATLDPYYQMFGIWPRVVQNASEYGLDGAVTRYRTWSEAREVLAAGGRIAMSVGLPLYSGHLMMLAGFNSSGNPIVHDPAKSNGYSYIFNKYDLSKSWFGKGGIAYTFYPADSSLVSTAEPGNISSAEDFELYQNYPNPFNPSTRIRFEVPFQSEVTLSVLDILGREIKILVNDALSPGVYETEFNAEGLSSGVYLYKLQAGYYSITRKMLILK